MKKKFFDYSKLKGIIAEHGYNLEALSQKINKTKGTLSQKLNNQIAFSQEEIVELVKILEIPKDQVYEIFFTEKVQKTQHNKNKERRKRWKR